jgi:hypothetical protein
MSKIRGLAEVLLEIDECRQKQSVASMTQPLRNGGFYRHFLAQRTGDLSAFGPLDL